MRKLLGSFVAIHTCERVVCRKCWVVRPTFCFINELNARETALCRFFVSTFFWRWCGNCMRVGKLKALAKYWSVGWLGGWVVGWLVGMATNDTKPCLKIVQFPCGAYCV